MSSTYKIDLTGYRFGRLTVLHHKITPGPKTFWVCRCDCGKEVMVGSGELKSGNTKSCGCLRRETSSKFLKNKSKKHGMFGTRIYHIWDGMKARCYNKSHVAYKNYGGRGVTVCDEWRNSFESFYGWAMSHGYQNDLTIDRIDNDGNYCPENCRWATALEQATNKRNVILLKIRGETKPISEWSRETGLSKECIKYRIKSGWPEEKILSKSKRRMIGFDG